MLETDNDPATELPAAKLVSHFLVKCWLVGLRLTLIIFLVPQNPCCRFRSVYCQVGSSLSTDLTPSASPADHRLASKYTHLTGGLTRRFWSNTVLHVSS